MNKRGNIILVFILMTALIVIAASFIFLISGKMRNITYELSSMRALYVAEAGLQKAMWDLSTSPEAGGQGLSWRTTGQEESYGLGKYIFSISDAGGNRVLIVSTAEVFGAARGVSQKVNLAKLPAAFDYAVFSNSGFTAVGDVRISGDIFGDGNISLLGSCVVANGEVFHPAGATVTGSGTSQFVDGGTPDPVPAMPVLVTTYYNNQIAIAEGEAAGNKTYTSDINLNGSTVYVKGDVDISGSGNISGPGAIVATGSISISGSHTSDGSDIKFISKNDMSLSGSSTIPNSLFYSKSNLKISGTERIIAGSFISGGDLTMSGTSTLQGLAYALGDAKFGGNVSCVGSLAASRLISLGGSVSITFDRDALPSDVPAGFTSEGIAPIKGSWKEL